MGKKLTKEEFIEKAKEIHGDKYNYDLVEYYNNYTKIRIICMEHGDFLQTPGKHKQGHGCRKCIYNNQKTTLKEFIIKANEKHNNKYDYSLVDYINCDTQVKILCPIHGIFEQTPYNHLKGDCNSCARDLNGKKKRLTQEKFLERVIEIHNNKYDYSLVEYINSDTIIKILCKKHGCFEQTADKHLYSKQGCPKCKNSLGEEIIIQILTKNKINYIFQKKFENCKNLFSLPFDFYLPDYNICIEYDGKQHYKPVEHFGGKKEFLKRKKRDRIKTDYCKKMKIKLIRIKYNENIKEKIKENIF